MTLDLKFEPRDLKKYLVWKQRKFDIILLIFATLIYFWIDFYMVIVSPLIIFAGYFILLVILVLFIYLLSQLRIYLIICKNQKLKIFGTFKLKLTKDKIIAIYNNTKIEYLKSTIKKIIITKKYISIKQNHSKNIVIILKHQMSDDIYTKLVAYIKQNYIK